MDRKKLLAVVALAWAEILAGMGRGLRRVKLSGETVDRMLSVAEGVRVALVPDVAPEIAEPVARSVASSRKRGPYKKRKAPKGGAVELFCGKFARHSYKPGATTCSRCKHKRRGAGKAKTSKPKSRPKAKAKPAKKPKSAQAVVVRKPAAAPAPVPVQS